MLWIISLSTLYKVIDEKERKILSPSEVVLMRTDS